MPNRKCHRKRLFSEDNNWKVLAQKNNLLINLPSLIIHKRILLNWKTSHEPKFTWHCNGTLTIFSFLFCFCQVHRFSTEHWFRWMRNSRFQLHEISLVQEWIIILFYLMLLGALIVLGAKSVWSFAFRCLFMRAATNLCCCMLSRLRNVASYWRCSYTIGTVAYLNWCMKTPAAFEAETICDNCENWIIFLSQILLFHEAGRNFDDNFTSARGDFRRSDGKNIFITFLRDRLIWSCLLLLRFSSAFI